MNDIGQCVSLQLALTHRNAAGWVEERTDLYVFYGDELLANLCALIFYAGIIGGCPDCARLQDTKEVISEVIG